MKSVSVMVLALWMIVGGSLPVMAAFPEETAVLDYNQITALQDDKLIESYIDVLAELEALKTFHTTSGFTPKEYQKYKGLVKYRLLLLLEINRRKIMIPPSIN